MWGVTKSEIYSRGWNSRPVLNHWRITSLSHHCPSIDPNTMSSHEMRTPLVADDADDADDGVEEVKTSALLLNTPDHGKRIKVWFSYADVAP
jgi:hypothetical protein